MAVRVAGDTAFIVSHNSNMFSLFDVSDPTNIVAKSTTTDTLDSPMDVFISGKYAGV
jgi:hypothetical protein